MKITKIEEAGVSDVFNMEVEDTHDYAVENGVIVHNCRYVFMEMPIAPRVNALTQIDLDDPLNLRTNNVRTGVTYMNL